MSLCNLCPRNCNINREDKVGFCGATDNIKVARAALHFWEEPCISGSCGSGTVFFSGCTLGCIYCQNYEISRGKIGKEITIDRLVDIYFELKEKGAANINLVTADHYIPAVVSSLKIAKNKGLDLPIIFNTSSYIKKDTISLLDGLVDVYLPDLKYADNNLAKKYSNSYNYFEEATAAISEMVRQRGCIQFDNNGYIKGGVIIRHLVLPDNVYNSKKVLKYIFETYGDNVFISIMSQYTPCREINKFTELNRRVKKSEYDKVVAYGIDLGIKNAFVQEGTSAKESFIPCFNLEGV